VHWDKASGEWNDFQEVKNLVPGRKIRPDGYLSIEELTRLVPSGTPFDSIVRERCVAEGKKGVVFLFHGHRWHGYPPNHPKYGDVIVYQSATGAKREVNASDLYAQTAADTDAYTEAGYVVVTIWESRFAEFESKGGSLISILDVY